MRRSLSVTVFSRVAAETDRQASEAAQAPGSIRFPPPPALQLHFAAGFTAAVQTVQDLDDVQALFGRHRRRLAG